MLRQRSGGPGPWPLVGVRGACDRSTFMTTSLPMKTTEIDLDKVTSYLKNQVGWVSLDKIRKAIPAKHAHAMKIEAMRHIGLLERDGENLKLSADGREYAGGDPAKRAEVMRNRLRADALYHATLEWMHFNDKASVTKTDVANYWHDHHASTIAGAKGDALTDSTVFFMRMAGVAELGRFVAAGAGRDTHFEADTDQLEEFVTGDLPPPREEQPGTAPPTPPAPVRTKPEGQFNVGTGLNVNIEIHIAADAKPATIEEIFRNMRKYLLEGSDSTADGG